jgi:hypothetical protein
VICVFIAVLVKIQLYNLLGTQILTLNSPMGVCPQGFRFLASCLPFTFKSKDESVPSKQERDNKSLLAESESEFYQWFVGFSDAESSFFIQPVLSSDGTKVSRFSFKFMIELHKDD